MGGVVSAILSPITGLIKGLAPSAANPATAAMPQDMNAAGANSPAAIQSSNALQERQQAAGYAANASGATRIDNAADVLGAGSPGAPAATAKKKSAADLLTGA